jgi:hypothetical protein
LSPNAAAICGVVYNVRQRESVDPEKHRRKVKREEDGRPRSVRKRTERREREESAPVAAFLLVFH